MVRRQVINQWLEVARGTLDPTDAVKYSFSASHTGQNGTLVLSNRKLVFVREKGRFRPSYHVTLEVPYSEINEVVQTGNQITLSEGDTKHSIVSGHAVSITRTLEELKGSVIIAR
jgi:hypothetical protein